MKRITLNVDPAEVCDLLERVPRACVTFADGGGPQLEPATVLYKDARYLVGMAAGAARHLAVGEEVVLVVDDGVQFFHLRAIYVRGHAQPVGETDGLAGELFWLEVQPERTVAWDYARIREAHDET